MLTLVHHEPIWEYFSGTQKDLIQEGNYLMSITEKHGYVFKDYSFLVFPYAKAYEGFLKQLFLDADFISHLDYISDHFRIGKFLSPHLIDRLKERSIYAKIQRVAGDDLASEIWGIWKKGRNEVFHYYPHNIKRLSFEDAKNLNHEILHTMIKAYEGLKHS
ncbi:hypothetical protein A2861_04025 [Candidatus Roizmanbacteria bacterium RIFCSPHIGHO2_01_FULL_38_15]|nr:MAG: hypothetical protein A2861_04025 [Candidatus Roizmanbacteria bacterium RIFCSPHIGHO2_01_FULL_38_15]OGK34879.1 MAG: hypothetical protein A3F59_02690 [Candidatus Roizmanbacteria bacterium RIFCSPHIGHO2_12_FULL_38_13]